LRRTASALVLGLLAVIGGLGPSAVPSVAAATPANPKVVIIVGATHGVTSTYRTYANEVYAEAIKYTNNVVKVYSPNATWSKVQSAVNGASIVVYLGHGNGWPSPYTYDPNYTTKDGFGLNASAGNGDYNNKYYGEPSIRTLDFAPNAVVLLFHLCYASGNSEPGNPEPSKTVAKQRADNYTAAFIRAGARAVIADGHSHSPYYIRSLFTTHETIDQLWRGAPNFHNHVISFTSARNAGYAIQMDPDNPSSGYYRSIGGKMSLRTDDVTGARYAATNLDPTSFSVGGNASVSTAAGAAMWQDGALTVPAEPVALVFETHVRIVSEVAPPPPAGRAFQVTGIDDPSLAGYVLAKDLRPRDSTGPQLWEMDDGTGAFSPNGDGSQDTIRFTGRFSEPVTWTMTFTDGSGTAVGTDTGAGSDDLAASWDGLVSGVPVADGAYGWRLEATDPWQNTPLVMTGQVVVDTVAPAFVMPTLAASSTTPTFSPNGDGRSDSISVGFSTNEAGTVEARVTSSGGAVVRSLAAATAAGKITWDGRTDAGSLVADGVYTVSMAPRDPAGNLGAPLENDVAVYKSLSNVAASATVFYPQDGDRFATYSILSFSLSKPATVTWQILAADGTVVRQRYVGAALAAGAYTFKWYGTNDTGARLPTGAYTSVVRASGGGLAITHTAAVQMNAFALRASDTTPARGQTITIYATSAETLSGAPSLRVYQPGISGWTVTMTHTSGRSYKATIRLKASSAGSVAFRVSGHDTDGGSQRTYLKLPLG
jgi:flagellar hook assembly protein FlgD